MCSDDQEASEVCRRIYDAIVDRAREQTGVEELRRWDELPEDAQAALAHPLLTMATAVVRVSQMDGPIERGEHRD